MKRWFPETAGSCFNTERRRQVRPWKKAGCFTLLRRITRLKNVNSEIRSGICSPSPKGSCQHESHTCSEQSFRILMWNASYLQKHSSYTWQEWVDERTREGTEKFPLSKYGRLRQLYIQWSNSTWSFVSKSEICGKFDVPVLGLAGLPFREMITRCRYAELIRLCITTNWQCLRWAVSVSRALPPCCESSRSFTSIQMFHTHICIYISFLYIYIYLIYISYIYIISVRVIWARAHLQLPQYNYSIEALVYCR